MKKRYQATIYIIEKIGNKHIYKQEFFKYWCFAWLFIFLEMINVKELDVRDVFDFEAEIIPI